jgi:hypothetical protein
LGSHFLPMVGGTRPEHVSAFAITGLHTAACKQSGWHHRLNVGSANSGPSISRPLGLVQ